MAASGLLIDYFKFYTLPNSQRRKLLEIRKIVKENKDKETSQILQLFNIAKS